MLAHCLKLSLHQWDIESTEEETPILLEMPRRSDELASSTLSTLVLPIPIFSPSTIMPSRVGIHPIVVEACCDVDRSSHYSGMTDAAVI